ncbi:DUF4328 domain-containing protein [Akkermansia sp.]|uniref:DUF4328 domain-containing protein n=1 Tax=Akkermansia sp. TaxID=1872421 RepID=UPI0025BBB71C|nr:DUF4328 domain-containing protein [Akkermansia sp.]MCC8148052.1 DUF4328 domain-containing protein [Akkermansia sp.]
MASSVHQQRLLFRSGKALPILLGIFSLVLIAGTAHVIFFQVSQIQDTLREMINQLISDAVSGQTGGQPEYVSYSPAWNANLAYLLSLASLGCLVCWFLMIYRLAADARRVGGTLMRMSPGECILSFFLPIVNLWRPLEALLNINSVLSTGSSRTGGAVLIWTAWAVSVPVTLLTFLGTFFLPLMTFMNVFQEWNEEKDSLSLESIQEGFQSIVLSVKDTFIYNGIVLMLGILFSTLMVFYLDFRSRKMLPLAAK